MTQKNEITMQIKSSNPIDFKAKKEALENLARLDTDALSFLGELSKSQKAVDKLMANKLIIKTMVM